MMCKAFSAVITRKKAYWKLGLDSHESIKEHFKLDDTTDKLCPVEITPKNGDYVNPDKWVFGFDESCPSWWKKSHELMSWEAHKEWNKQLRKKLYVKRLNNLINPLDLPEVRKVTRDDVKNLKDWASVGDSVCDSVWASVGDSVRAYTGYMFRLKRSDWKYIENIKSKQYPFISGVKLWEKGLVPSFDGKVWRLHSGKKAKVVFEITKEKLEKVSE